MKKAVGLAAWGVLEDIALDATLDGRALVADIEEQVRARMLRSMMSRPSSPKSWVSPADYYFVYLLAWGAIEAHRQATAVAAAASSRLCRSGDAMGPVWSGAWTSAWASFAPGRKAVLKHHR